MFLFHSTRTTNQICTSFNRVVLLLLLVLFIFCCTVPRLTNAYPMSTQFNNHRENFQQINDENSLQRNQRGTGYHIVRHGDFLLLVPDSKHHFTKNIRLYIGR